MSEFINNWGDEIAMPLFMVVAVVLFLLAGAWDARRGRGTARGGAVDGRAMRAAQFAGLTAKPSALTDEQQEFLDRWGMIPCSNCGRQVWEDDGRHVGGGYNCEGEGW